MTKPIVAFRNFAKAPKIQKYNEMLTQYTLQLIRPTIDLHPSCLLEQFIVNQKGANQKTYSRQEEGLSVIEHSQPKGVKPKMREPKIKK
jgi:hypothetical protein